MYNYVDTSGPSNDISISPPPSLFTPPPPPGYPPPRSSGYPQPSNSGFPPSPNSVYEFVHQSSYGVGQVRKSQFNSWPTNNCDLNHNHLQSQIWIHLIILVWLFSKYTNYYFVDHSVIFPLTGTSSQPPRLPAGFIWGPTGDPDKWGSSRYRQIH